MTQTTIVTVYDEEIKIKTELSCSVIRVQLGRKDYSTDFTFAFSIEQAQELAEKLLQDIQEYETTKG